MRLYFCSIEYQVKNLNDYYVNKHRLGPQFVKPCKAIFGDWNFFTITGLGCT